MPQKLQVLYRTCVPPVPPCTWNPHDIYLPFFATSVCGGGEKDEAASSRPRPTFDGFRTSSSPLQATTCPNQLTNKRTHLPNYLMTCFSPYLRTCPLISRSPQRSMVQGRRFMQPWFIETERQCVFQKTRSLSLRWEDVWGRGEAPPSWRREAWLGHVHIGRCAQNHTACFEANPLLKGREKAHGQFE